MINWSVFDEYNVYGGDCVDIAFALAEELDGTVVCSYASQQEFKDGIPAHCAVKVDGKFYDGGGETSKEALIERAYDGSRSFDEIVVREIQSSPRKDEKKIEEIREKL